MKKVTFLIFFNTMLASGVLVAQPPTPGGGTGTPSCFPPPCIPIDGGLSWLLIAGTVYGGKKIYGANKEKNEEL